MKNLFVGILFISVLGISMISCGGEKKKQETPVEVTKDQYRCPMKCTEEIFEKPGTCKVCGMELEKITKS